MINDYRIFIIIFELALPFLLDEHVQGPGQRFESIFHHHRSETFQQIGEYFQGSTDYIGRKLFIQEKYQLIEQIHLQEVFQFCIILLFHGQT
jgi:hypothetical protein